MPQYPSFRALSIAALAIGASFCAQAQDSVETEEMPVTADDTAVPGGKTCYVSKIKFENEGAYQVFHFQVGGENIPGRLLSGQSRTWKLGKTNPESGDTFFLRYEGDQGDQFKSKNCDKNGTVLKYHPDGNAWAHWSKGTTKYNKRCRFSSSKNASRQSIDYQT